MLHTNRRIIVGLTGDGRSTVAADAHDIAVAQPLPGYRLQELWSQSSLPADPDDNGLAVGEIDVEPPSEGALVRILTVDSLPLAAWIPNPHGDSNRHVLTLVAGTIDLVLESVEVTMTPGDTVVLAGHVHDWRNTYDAPAILVYTTFPLGAPSEKEKPAEQRSAAPYCREF